MTLFSVAIITISDKGAAGIRNDESGKMIHKMIEKLPGNVVGYEISPDQIEKIQKQIFRFCDMKAVDLLFTTGGTGPSPRDVTPEATAPLIDKPFPGISEMLRMCGYQKNPMAILSRGVSGIRGKTLIINLPGSPKAVEEGLTLLLPILPHALKKIAGDEKDCGVLPTA
ncbi:MAG: MogA/MoaB family molybdenum cofactor biosynthesis protein [Nitrospirota bacterium]